MILAAGTIIFFIITPQQDRQPSIPQTSTNTNLPTSPTTGTPSTSKPFIPTPTSVATSSGQPTTITTKPYNSENVLQDKISILLQEWQTTGKPASLKEALTLSTGTSNETVLYAWVPIMSSRSSEVVSLIESTTDNERSSLLNASSDIFEWFVELSGVYETLSPAARQDVIEGYGKIKSYTNERL